MTLSTYLKRGRIGYLIMTVICVVFAVIYEFAGHGVYSLRIRFLWTVPLVMLIVFLALGKINFEPYIQSLTFLRLFAASEIARNAFVGIVEVYGTTSSKAVILLIISIALAASTVVSVIFCAIKRRRTQE